MYKVAIEMIPKTADEVSEETAQRLVLMKAVYVISKIVPVPTKAKLEQFSDNLLLAKENYKRA